MHDFLRAVGFSNIHNRSDMQRVLNLVLGAPEESFVQKKNGISVFEEKKRDFAKHAGITVRGDVDESGVFIYDYFFPHYSGSSYGLIDNVILEKSTEREEYFGVCDVANIGVSVVFHMNRLKDYADYTDECFMKEELINLSALSVSGKILLPLFNSKEQERKRLDTIVKRKSLMTAAKEGDPEAIESLTLEEMDLYSSISRRLADEDILTIVESTFMPYGVGSNQYSILGDILAYEPVINQLTGEKLHQMRVRCNGLCIDVCINDKDLYGIPEIGRRFKGDILLQGYIEKEV